MSSTPTPYCPPISPSGPPNGPTAARPTSTGQHPTSVSALQLVVDSHSTSCAIVEYDVELCLASTAPCVVGPR
ncbi:hypothetical protein DFP72DRAFT_1078122 [Ephemerocybe angulata]|uniref:Uncharacterized protein n=1 Tax=Ephemerocybe angulata TaxID=980116 RepID=A0A8H6LWK0_9AGAR|nr:hypothetical protein DFP72DRAFT_1078122 [Tulosesus angulatus]